MSLATLSFRRLPDVSTEPERLLKGTASKSAVLDRAYAEYHRLAEMGEAPSLATFSRRYSAFGDAVYRMLLIEGYLEANAEGLDEEPPDDWPEPGETFLGYCLLQELGRGALARVYLAREPRLGDRLVVIKVSPANFGEAKTLGRLVHTNVVPVNGVATGRNSRLTAVCMPYLGTATLHELLTAAFSQGRRPTRADVILQAARCEDSPSPPTGRLHPPAQVLLDGSYVEGICYLGLQIAEALAYIHDLGIVHRDLKPSNVLLCPDGRPMLLDFNLAADERRRVNLLGGTFPYMAPELLRATADETGPPVKTDARTDLYSLGVLLYELLAGRPPFNPLQGKATEAAQRDHLLERQAAGLPPLREIEPTRPQLARLVESLLALDPAHRPQCAADVAAVLQWELAARDRRRQRPAPWKQWVAAVLLTLGVGTAASMNLANRTAPPDLLARAQKELAQGNDSGALDLLLNAAPAEAQRPDIQFLRGRVHQKQGDLVAAQRAYEAADPDRTEGRVQACLAYCLAHLEKYEDAADAAQRARQAGYATPEVFNTLAFCQIRLRLFDAAAENLDQMPAGDAPHQAAQAFNRFLLIARRFTRVQEGPPPAKTLADLDAGLALAPGPAEVLCEAAYFCVRCDGLLKDWQKRALTYLEQAQDAGADLRRLRGSPPYQKLASVPRFQMLTQPRALVRRSPQEGLLLDPVRDGE